MYDQTVHLLDLCILSYQLHAQTLIWPLDPYYECSTPEERRMEFMNALRTWCKGVKTLHGPGRCQGSEEQGWGTNDLLDPVFSDYTRIYPWRPTFTRPDAQNEPWIVYDAPKEITRRIGKVCMAQYDFGDDGPHSASPLVKLTVIHKNHPQTDVQPPAKDLLYCFEGGTGTVYGETQKKYPSWSMMGFVLASVSEKSDDDYDLYIVFRGSRSGKLRHYEAGWEQQGNSDWVTDWQWLYLEKDLEISQYGQCSKGFMASIKSMFLTIMKCLEEVASQKKGARPSAIYVTGHSLGAALACHFASAILWGTRYGLWGNKVPATLQRWPWYALRLVTYAAPAVGDWEFCRSFTMVNPSSKRVWVEGDTVALSDMRGLPMGSDLAKAGKTVLTAVGEAFRLSPPKDVIKGLDPHDPLAIRKSLLWWLGSFPQILQEIPMKDDQPWKLFTSTKTLLDHLADKKQPAEFSALISDSEAFFLTVIDALRTAHSKEEDVKKELGSLSNMIKKCNASHDTAYVKLGKLRDEWQGLTSFPDKGSVLKSKYNALWRLLGLSLLFNALSKDGSLMQSRVVGTMIDML